MKSLVRIVLFSLVSSLAFAAGSKVASDMPASTESGMVEVIVQYKTFAGVRTVDAAGPLGRVRRYFRSIPATHMTVPVSMLRSLASNPQVAYISPNRTTTGFLDATATQTVHADHVWSEGWDGTGVGVAIIDSGVALKPDLATADGSHSRVVFSENFVSGRDASDEYGHGTHVAGIVAGNGARST
jgi:serine protease AprX